MAKGKRGPGRPNKLRLDWLEPESTFQIKLAERFPELSNLSQLELEAKHKELYIEAFKKAEAAAGGVLEGRNKVAFKTAFKKKWGALLIPDRRGHYFKGRLGDAPLWRVRYGDKTFVPTIADHATQQQRVWRGQFLTNAGVGTPLSLEQLKRKFIDPLTGLTLSAHHRDGLSEANPYIDDVIAKLVNGQVYQKTKGKYGSLKDVKAGNREFQQFQRVFEKRKIASGDVLEQFDMVMEPLHTKSKPTKMGGGAIHVQQSLEGVSTASGKPLTDKLPDGTIIGDLDPEVRANAYVDEVERIRPIKDRIVKDALANPDLYPEPFKNPAPVEVYKRGPKKGQPKDLWAQSHPAQTLLDNKNIGSEGVRQLTPKQGWPSRLPGGVEPSNVLDPWTGSSVHKFENMPSIMKGVLSKTAPTAHAYGGDAAVMRHVDIGPMSYLAKRAGSLIPVAGAVFDEVDRRARTAELNQKMSSKIGYEGSYEHRMDQLQLRLAEGTVASSFWAEPVNVGAGLLNLGLDVGRTLTEKEKRDNAVETARNIGAGVDNVYNAVLKGWF